jgi:hypothetical protein
MTWRNIRRLGSAKRAPENQTNASRERARGMTTVAPRRASRVATGRRDTHVTREQSPVGIGIDAQEVGTSTISPAAEATPPIATCSSDKYRRPAVHAS